MRPTAPLSNFLHLILDIIPYEQHKADKGHHRCLLVATTIAQQSYAQRVNEWSDESGSYSSCPPTPPHSPLSDELSSIPYLSRVILRLPITSRLFNDNTQVLMANITEEIGDIFSAPANSILIRTSPLL